MADSGVMTLNLDKMWQLYDQMNPNIQTHSNVRCLVTRLSFFYSLFSRSAANILLLEGDRRQVFCNSPCGSIVCLLLCTGECPIVQ